MDDPTTSHPQSSPTVLSTLLITIITIITLPNTFKSFTTSVSSYLLGKALCIMRSDSPPAPSCQCRNTHPTLNSWPEISNWHSVLPGNLTIFSKFTRLFFEMTVSHLLLSIQNSYILPLKIHTHICMHNSHGPYLMLEYN